MKVLIVGGGIGGMSAAISLRRIGLEVDLIEHLFAAFGGLGVQQGIRIEVLRGGEIPLLDGAALEFIDPATGGPTLPTMSCRVQMLQPGEKTQSHRHTSTAIYHAFRGSGTTMINGEKFAWQKGDTFIVPLWSWHEHGNASATDEAILFSMHDEPILRAFGLYREEAQANS